VYCLPRLQEIVVKVATTINIMAPLEAPKQKQNKNFL
jgi:hypothetical protein